MPDDLYVDLVRGTTTESRHRVHVAVVDTTGRLVARSGDPDLVTFMRSVAKPFQAMPLVADGAAARFGLTSEELALCCASHSSAPDQVERVRGLLTKIGVGEASLRCGPHRPLSGAVAADYERRGITLTAIHSNCSGKHAGMLALARHHGWPVEDYTEPEHPVQRRCLAEVSRWTGVPEDAIGQGTDGCGVVTFAVPVRHMALAWAKLGSREQGSASSPQSRALLLAAMLHHSDLLAGPDRPCTQLMEANPDRLVAKVGAEGVYAAVLPGERLGVALKVEDGHASAAVLAVVAVLGALGLENVPDALRRRAVLNLRGATVGELRVTGGLTR